MIARVRQIATQCLSESVSDAKLVAAERVAWINIRCFVTSENQLQRELNVPWSTAAEEWVADADVGRHSDREKARATSSHRID